MASEKKLLNTVTPIVTTDDNGDQMTTIEIDGKIIYGVTNYTIGYHSGGVAKVSIEMLAKVGTVDAGD